MNLSLTSPLNEVELGINLASLFYFSRKIEVVFGKRYIFYTYLITLGVTALSFLPCNMMKNVDDNVNPNSLNLVFSQIIYMKYRLEYLNNPFLNFVFLLLIIYLIFPDNYLGYHETRNILLSALISSSLL